MNSLYTLKKTFLLTICFFLIVTIAAVAVSVLSYGVNHRGQSDIANLQDKVLPALTASSALRDSTHNMHAACLEFVLGRDDAAMVRAAEAIKNNADTISSTLTTIKDLSAGGDSEQHIAQFTQAFLLYTSAATKLQAYVKGNDLEKAMAVMDNDLSQSRKALRIGIDELSLHLVELNQQSMSNFSADLTKNLGIILLVSALLGCAALGALILVQCISHRSMKLLTGASNRLASVSQEVLGRSGDLSESSQSMADDASKQAAAIEETSASLEEIASATSKNAKDASSAQSLSSQARTAADDGARNMSEMRQAMDNIRKSSNEISAIIKTIDEIAFQTNILALNAAVEAARAGEAGAGFAVVADEVRALAQRCAQAARETSEKIQQAIDKTQSGVVLTATVGENFNKMIEYTRSINTLLSGIANANQEQSLGISQLRESVSQINQVTQATAGAAEQGVNDASCLNAQATELQVTVESIFAVIGGNQYSTATASYGSSQKGMDALTDNEQQPRKVNRFETPSRNGHSNGVSSRAEHDHSHSLRN
ncbi:MAG: methyl-accepting chemotaxis protein [Verrucomicrobiota bacterium]|nr:methyl-accepting chemotaxis protein [Verrucomicrobiota bacterium]